MKTIAMLACVAAFAVPAHAADKAFRVGAFTKIETHGSDDVRLVPGDFAVSATGKPEALDALRITVHGHTLDIRRRSGTYHDDGAVVTVRAPMVRRVEMHGSGDLSAARIAQDAFTLSISGSSDADIGELRVSRADFLIGGSGGVRLARPTAADLSIDVHGSGSVAIDNAAIGALDYEGQGSGDFTITGTARTASLAVSGSGEIDADALDTATLVVDISGSADVDARSHGKAAIHASGSGSVRVAGNPRCSVSSSGTATVDCD